MITHTIKVKGRGLRVKSINKLTQMVEKVVKMIIVKDQLTKEMLMNKTVILIMKIQKEVVIGV